MNFKWIFAALVLANVGLWMWANWYKDAPLEESRNAREAIAPEKMRLLNESGVKTVPRKSPVPADAVLTDASAPMCFDLGPFPDAASVVVGENKLLPLSVSVSRRAEETQTVTGYQVFLPPLPTKADAERKREELNRLGFRDHALIQEGPLENAISLGLFSVAANAEARARELGAKQVAARIQPFQQTRTRYWLDIRASAESAAALKTLTWSEAEVKLRAHGCPSPEPAMAPVSDPG